MISGKRNVLKNTKFIFVCINFRKKIKWQDTEEQHTLLDSSKYDL